MKTTYTYTYTYSILFYFLFFRINFTGVVIQPVLGLIAFSPSKSINCTVVELKLNCSIIAIEK